MKLFIGIILTTAFIVKGDQLRKRNGKRLDPEYAGTMHTKAFEILSDMYSVKKPLNREEMMTDSGKVLVSFCDDEDSTCKENALPLAIKHFRNAENEDETQSIDYSDDFDAELVILMDKLESTISELNSENTDDILDQIVSIKKDIENTDNVQAHYKEAALSSLSVAFESIELWNKVYSDSSHPLYGIHYPSHYFQNDDREDGNENRKLQQNFDFVGIVMADFRGGLNAGMETSDILTIAITIATNAIPASLAKLLGQADSYYYGGDGYNYEEGYSNDDGDGYNGNGDYYKGTNANDEEDGYNGDGDYYEETNGNDKEDGYSEDNYYSEDGYSDDGDNCFFGFLCL